MHRLRLVPVLCLAAVCAWAAQAQQPSPVRDALNAQRRDLPYAEAQ
jgi:hypothetical protein